MSAFSASLRPLRFPWTDLNVTQLRSQLSVPNMATENAEDAEDAEFVKS